jgi:hypothetical protein
MKKLLLFTVITILMSISVLGINENISNPDASTTELAVAQLYDCSYNSYQLSQPTGVFAYLRTEFYAQFNQKAKDCLDANRQVQLVASANNITDTYSMYSAKQIDQLGLDEFVYLKEKERILTSINSAWDYVHLLFSIFIELIMIFYYVLELYLLVYVLFIALPKSFLKIRDGISIFLVRRKRRDNTQHRETTVNYNYTYRQKGGKSGWFK